MTGPAATTLPVRRRLVLAYDGTAYAGWQVQPDQPTVQGVLEEALARVLGQPVRVVGSGRTDAGVHALGQVCHLDDPRGWPVARLAGALNAALPDDVRVAGAEAVAPDFHALQSARSKTYFYQLHLSTAPGGARAVERSVPPWRRFTFHAVRAGLDLGAMRAAATHLVGRHDFTTLSKAMPPGRGTVKTVRAVRIRPLARGLRVFVTAEGFLYGMMRLLTGLLVEVGRGRVDPGAVPGLLGARDRALSPPSLPARGLFLWRVDYEASGGAQRGAAGPAILGTIDGPETTPGP